MAGLVFKPTNIAEIADKVQVGITDKYKRFYSAEEEGTGQDEEIKPSDIFHAPTIEELEEELTRYKEEVESELKEKIKEAEKRAKEIIKQAEETAYLKVARANEKAKAIIEDAEIQARKQVENAKIEAERMIKEAELRVTEIEQEAYNKGYKEGRDAGYKDGEEEVKRLISRLGDIISAAIDVRNEIIESSEKQIMNIILLIARKIIKDETRERKGIVLNQIREALKKIRDKEEIIIRVNLEDLELTTAHKEEFMQMVEGLRKVRIFEDNRVDRGGAIIEVDIGAIDARISTQLEEIENRIRDYAPLEE